MIEATAPLLDIAGQLVVTWALWTARLRDIAERPWGVFDGQLNGELLYWAPDFKAAWLLRVRTGR